jgi:hypothetical protein
MAEGSAVDAAAITGADAVAETDAEADAAFLGSTVNCCALARGFVLK